MAARLAVDFTLAITPGLAGSDAAAGALARLGVHDEVMAVAERVPHVGCIGPRGGALCPPAMEASTTNPSTRPDDLRRRFSPNTGEDTIAKKTGRFNDGGGPKSAGLSRMNTGSVPPVTSKRISVG